jgi:hypothetical protein
MSRSVAARPKTSSDGSARHPAVAGEVEVLLDLIVENYQKDFSTTYSMSPTSISAMV